MKRNQNRNLGELITIFLDNGDLTEDDVMPLLKKGTASSLKEKEEKIFVQPLTEGEGEEKGCRDCLCVDEVSDWCKGECLCHHKSQENKECEHPNEFQQLGIDKDERGTLCCIKCGYYRFSQPQQESKEEEYIDGFKIECEHGSRGRCLKCLGLEEPPKKEVTTKKEENCGELSKSPQELCYEGICPGEGKCDAVTKGWPHRHKRNGDWIYSRIEGKETFKPVQEPSKKPVCYCGHPKERHFVQYKSLVEGNQLSCRHCECFEYADNELHNQGEI